MRQLLDELSILIRFLPTAIPEGCNHHDFRNWNAGAEDVEMYGSEGALNHALEISFARQGHQPGDIPFKLCERGAGLHAVVGVLSDGLSAHPKSAILEKWVGDLVKACKAHYHEAGIDLPTTGILPGPLSEADDASSSPETGVAPSKKGGRKSTQTAGRTPLVSTLMSSSTWDDYEAVEESKNRSKKGGPEACPLSRQLALACYDKRDPKKNVLFRCCGMDPNRQVNGSKAVCGKTYARPHRNPQHIFAHAADCEHLPSIHVAGAAAKTSQTGTTTLDFFSARTPSASASASQGTTKLSAPSTTTKICVERLAKKARVTPVAFDYPEWKTLVENVDPHLATPSST